jgi:muramoyltetrapeptide carboxypeptidase
MPLRHPRPLVMGSRVAVVSPAGPVLPEHLAPGIAQLEAWGLEVVVPEAVYDRLPRPRGFLAGTDEARAGALNAALRDDSVDAIVFARGGHGALRILERIDWAALAARPKVLMGFSDITALLSAAWQECGLVGLHGPVVKSFTLHAEAGDVWQVREHVRRALFGERGEEWSLGGLECAREGVASGRLMGGNLCLVAALMGTPWAVEAAGALVFLEEVGEVDYRVDRLMTQLRLAWRRSPPAGLMLGEFTGLAGVYAGEDEVTGFLIDLARELEIPAVVGLPVGHGARNVPLPVGVMARLDAGAGELVVYGDCVHG